MNLTVDSVSSAAVRSADLAVAESASTKTAQTAAPHAAAAAAQSGVVVQGDGLHPAYAQGDSLARAASAADAAGQSDPASAHADFLTELHAKLSAPASGDAGTGDAARLQALQIRQHLQAQPSAAIANAAPQAILSLFKN